MHSPAMSPDPLSRLCSNLGKLIECLDQVAELLERDEYVQLRRRMVDLYLDTYYVARVPYDQARDSPPADR